MIKEKIDKFLRLLLAVTIFATSFSYAPRVLASGNNSEYVKGQIIDPVNSIGSIENAGDVKLTKTVSATDTEGVYNVDITVEGKHKEETQVTTAPIYTVVVLDRSGSMYKCKNGINYCFEYDEVKYSSAKEGAKAFATTLLNKYSQAQLALVTFSTNVTVKRNFASTNFDSVSFPDADGMTNLAEAIKTASDLLLNKKKENSNAKLYMVILSDGKPEYYSYQPNNHFGEANKAKNNGIEIFTIGYETDDETEEILTKVATDDDHFVKADSSNIVDSFDNIASEIKVETPAGVDATITDAIADGFSYVGGSASIETSINGKNVSFDIGDITDEGKTVTFQIEVNKDLETGLHRTNDFAKVVYTDLNGDEQTVNLEDSSKVYWEQLKYNYKINYKEQGTNVDLDKAKEVNDAIYGRTYSEVAPTFEGYNLVEGTNNPSEITITEDNQELTFYYTKKNDLTYTVKYLEEGTNKELAKEKKVLNQTFLDNYSETAINIEGYNVVGDKTQTGTIDSESLVITFYYTKKTDLTYTVKYLEEGSNKELAKEKKVLNQTFLNSYKEEALNITGYNVVGTGIEEGVINSENLVITFYYTKKTDLTYIIDYFKDDVKVSNDSDNTYNNMTYGDLVTINDINNKVNKYKTEGYNDGVVETSLPLEIQDGENKIIIRYNIRTDLSYRVEYYYDNVIDDSKTEEYNNIKYGTSINKYEDKLIDGYEFVKDSGLITVGEGENVIRVYYVSTYVPAPLTGVDNNNDLLLMIMLMSLSTLLTISVTRKLVK